MKIIFYIIFSFYMAIPAFAEELIIKKADAIDVLQENTEALLAIVSAEDYHSKKNHKAMKKAAEDIVMRLFSFEDFTMLAVGKRWHSFSDIEKAKMTKACTGLLKTTYIGYLDEYDNERIEYIASTKANNNTRAQIDAIALATDKQIPISFRMLKNGEGTWQVYDVLIEGISLVKNYRIQFSELLLSNSAEEVVLILEEKNQALLSEKGK